MRLKLSGKKIGEVHVVFSGAGAAGIACVKFYERLGVKRTNMLLVDTKGVVHKGRTEGMNPYKDYFAQETNCRTLADALKGADVFCGVSVKDILTKEMVRSMADNPVVFAMANPDPEITYENAIAARPDIIIATGRPLSQSSQQCSRLPVYFPGALDVRAIHP